MPESLGVKILAIISRATFIEGGSTTLITRFGILSWIDAEHTSNTKKLIGLQELRTRLLRTCDQDRINQWSSNTIHFDVFAEE
jgi:nucleolar pre-ribosomal-associated protein 1